MKFYSPIEFSPNIRKTPEGFLACEGVPIARAGTLEYRRGETPVDAGAGGRVLITRTTDVLFDQECLASFESKPITLDHPPDFVTPETFKEYAVGAVQNVRGDGDRIIADLLIMDEKAIKAVENGVYRELSCGYEADYEQVAQGRGIQTKILGNHVALVSHGRCGATCAIFDNAPEEYDMKDKFFGLLGTKTADEETAVDVAESTPENLAETLKSILARLDALENPTVDEPAPAEAVEEKASDDDRLVTIENLLKELLSKLDTKDDAENNTFDAATLAAGEILAPELKPCKDYAQKALDVAYSTKDGRETIDALLCGRAMDSADKTLFIAAAELLKTKRRAAFDAQPKVSIQRGVMTAEALNDLNSKFYGRK